MAAQNRDELQTQIDSTFVPTLQIVDHRTYLKDPQAESLVFRKDVIASQSPAGGSVAINFANKDLATVTTTGNLAVSFTGMENGDVKYLRITKNAGNTVSFTGATDVSPRRTYINTTVTVVYYRVINKNNTIFVCAESVDFDFQPDIDSAISSNLSGITFGSLQLNPWDMRGFSVTSKTYAVPSGKKIINMGAVIRNDANTRLYNIHSITDSDDDPGGNITYNVSVGQFELYSSGNGFFNSTSFSSTGFSRGDIFFGLIDS